MNEKRERLGSRIGFILLSVGCAVGLGNVWRFPYITGQYGGAAFVLIYLFFLIILALPIMVMEFSVGRASRTNIAASFSTLRPGSPFRHFGKLGILGNYLLMMFYTTISGWLLAYLWKAIKGDFVGVSPEQVQEQFAALTVDVPAGIFWLGLCIFLGLLVCFIGLRKGVERITVFMMSGLFVIILILVVRSLTLDNAGAGIEFYLKPNFNGLVESGLWEAVYAAMGQAFFTLSLGIGSMAIFGSYISRERSLTGESISIVGLDTLVALLAGLIIFPAAASFGVDVGQGPGLIFITLPNIFNSMSGGHFWSILFFLFMAFAALSTVIAVFENIVSFGIDVMKWSRRKSCIINFFVLFIASLPCLLGFSVWEHIQPLGAGSSILGLEDFLVSQNLLPLGALVYLVFCCTRAGWGWDNFIAEADAGSGIKFPKKIRPYVTYVLPIIMIVIFIQGYINTFFAG